MNLFRLNHSLFSSMTDFAATASGTFPPPSQLVLGTPPVEGVLQVAGVPVRAAAAADNYRVITITQDLWMTLYAQSLIASKTAGPRPAGGWRPPWPRSRHPRPGRAASAWWWSAAAGWGPRYSTRCK